MAVIITEKMPEKAADLLNQKFTVIGENRYEAGQVSASIVLTLEDMQRLKQAFAPYRPNILRATRVKELIMQGKSQAEVIRALRVHGYRYSERSIKTTDRALRNHYPGKAKNPIKKVQVFDL